VLNLKRIFFPIGRIIDEGIITLFIFYVYLVVTKSKSPILVPKGFKDKSTSLYIFSPKSKKGYFIGNYINVTKKRLDNIALASFDRSSQFSKPISSF
jgi:hypothetical protein